MNSNANKLTIDTSHQNNMNFTAVNNRHELLAHFHAKINTEKTREDRQLLIPISPDLKYMMGKSISKQKIIFTENPSRKINLFNESMKYKAINVDLTKSIEVSDTFKLNSETIKEIELTDTDNCRNLPNNEEIFSTASSLNVEEESIETKFRNAKENVRMFNFYFK